MSQNPFQKQTTPPLYLPSDPNRPSVYRMGVFDEEVGEIVRDGRTGYRASELGRCIRALVLCKLGFTPQPFDEKTKEIMKIGNAVEPAVAEMFQSKMGGVVQRQVRIQMDIQDEQDIEIAVVGGVSDGLWFQDEDDLQPDKFDVILNPDAEFDTETVVYHSKLTGSPAVWGIEIKVPGESMFKKQIKEGPSEGYKVQISIYWHAYEEMLGVELMGFVFAMICRDDGEYYHRIYTKPWYTKQQLVERIWEVERLAEKGLDYADCDTKDFFCRYWRFHKETTAESTGYDKSMNEMVSEYAEVSKELKGLEERQKVLKKQIDIAMKGRDKVSTDGFSVYYSSRNFVNFKLMLGENPWLASKYTKFDLDKCLEANPTLKEKYKAPGDRFLTVRANRRSVGGGSGARKTKEIQLRDVSESAMDALMAEIMNEGEGQVNE